MYVQAVGKNSQPMAIRKGNTAPMRVISRRGLEVGSRMDKKEFEAERRYHGCLSLARTLRAKGLLTEEEYEQIDTILLEKYRPTLSTLLSGKRLL